MTVSGVLVNPVSIGRSIAANSSGAYDTINNGRDVFVTKINPAGNGINDLLYSTFLGGTNYDYGFGIAVDLEGAVYVTGGIWSTDFPTTVGAYDTSSNGELDAFLSKISFQVTLTISTSTGGTTDPSPGTHTYMVFEKGDDTLPAGHRLANTALSKELMDNPVSFAILLIKNKLSLLNSIFLE